jgi:hypothetical protein
MSEAGRTAPRDGEPIAADEIAEALTRAPFAYADGATQVFTRDGRTIYTENGAPSAGEWGVDGGGRFWSFWPPAYRATYEVSWVTDAGGAVAGIRFADREHGTVSEGRYAPDHP